MEVIAPPNKKISLELKPVSNTTAISSATVVTESNVITKKTPFIEANTIDVRLDHLQKECIIPVFSKDNEKTIAHQEFIEMAYNSALKVFEKQQVSMPEIRVSHQVKGRIPDAIHKPAKDLLEHDKTIYYERMAFIMQIPTITDTINGNTLMLTIGGVRSYNLENLYSKKSYEKFKFFIGFQNTVCCNLCISTDGLKEEIKVLNIQDLQESITQAMRNYNLRKHFHSMKELANHRITEKQFAQLVGKSRLYQYLPKDEKADIPMLQFNDSHISSIAKDYYEDKRFCRDETGDINLWNVYNLFTSANKSSYIDSFLGRNANALDFTLGLSNTINGTDNYHWFLG